MSEKSKYVKCIRCERILLHTIDNFCLWGPEGKKYLDKKCRLCRYEISKSTQIETNKYFQKARKKTIDKQTRKNKKNKKDISTPS